MGSRQLAADLTSPETTSLARSPATPYPCRVAEEPEAVRVRTDYLGYAIAAVIVVTFIYTRLDDGYENERVGRVEASERRTQYQERLDCSPYVVRRSELSPEEELVQIAIFMSRLETYTA